MGDTLNSRKIGVTPHEAKVLHALAYFGGEDSECGFVGFKPLAAETGLDRRTVRLACRSLSRKGFAKFARGLWTDEGEPAGAGYAATLAGMAKAEELTAPKVAA